MKRFANGHSRLREPHPARKALAEPPPPTVYAIPQKRCLKYAEPCYCDATTRKACPSSGALARAIKLERLGRLSEG